MWMQISSEEKWAIIWVLEIMSILLIAYDIIYLIREKTNSENAEKMTSIR